MEQYSTRLPFGFAMSVLCLVVRSTTINYWVMTSLKLMLTPSFITSDLSAVVVAWIYSYVYFSALVPNNYD